MAIFYGFLTTIIIWLDLMGTVELKVLTGVLLFTFGLGLSDDLVHLKPGTKIIGQVIAANLAFFLLEVRIVSTYSFFGQFALPLFFSYVISITYMIIVTNAFNLIDGIDGLAGSVAIICFVTFGTLFQINGVGDYAIVCFALVGATTAFMFFNWEPAKIFMGDTGALMIGMLLSIVSIKFINLNASLKPVVRFSSPLSLVASTLILPLTDTVRIIILRLYQGVSPFKADKQHIHHILVRLGFSHRRSVIILTTLQVALISASIICYSVTDYIVLPAVVSLAIILSVLLQSKLNKIKS